MAAWPTGEVTFLAYSPQGASANISAGSLSDANRNRGEMSSLTYSVPEATSAQEDLLVAVAKKSFTPGAGTVTLNFKHALSRLQFKAQYVDGSSNTIDVTGIALFNLKKSGTLDLRTADAVANIAWTGQTDNVDSLSLVGAGFDAPVPKGGGHVPVLTGGDAVMVMPQTTALGSSKYGATTDRNGDTNAAIASGAFYVLVTWTVGTGQTRHSLCAVPDPSNLSKGVEFKPGRQYTFTFTLDGNDNLTLGGGVGVENMNDEDGGTVMPPPI
ncbi:MAG: fimbrillin family protein [Rikenellaceae bacterium]|jgi:hypothetical protein|nr:fimbrillin family protein [Rikenellaceae bacterium]